jgi:hypothetical protein
MAKEFQRMSGGMSLSEFCDCVRSDKHTRHQLRMKLQSLRRSERFDALLEIFYENHFSHQQVAGWLLLDVTPQCYRSLDEILLNTVPTWNVSVEELPLYLRRVFGHEEVVQLIIASGFTRS